MASHRLRFSLPVSRVIRYESGSLTHANPLIGRATDRQSKVFEPTTIEIRFQHLHKVEEGPQQASLVPVIERHPSPEDGSGYLESVSVFLFFWFVAPYCVCANALTCNVSTGPEMM